MVRPNPHRAFTLIELLVVVAIIALLVSILMPMMAKAKAIARRIACAANMRNIGQAAWIFAGEHGGRGPGYAHRSLPTGSSISWVNILNQEYFKTDRIVRMTNVPVTNKLSCPSMEPWGTTLYNRPFMWNSYAIGEPNKEGLWVDLPKIQPNYPGVTLDRYALGVVLDRFTQANYKFLMIENERASDEFSTGDANPATGRYTVQLGGSPMDTSYAPWAGGGGVFAFRHVRPNVNSSDYAKQAAAYQTQATGNFLFVDTHVESLTPMARIRETRRSSYP